MGRRAKYLTLEERNEARRIQRLSYVQSDKGKEARRSAAKRRSDGTSAKPSKPSVSQDSEVATVRPTRRPSLAALVTAPPELLLDVPPRSNLRPIIPRPAVSPASSTPPLSTPPDAPTFRASATKIPASSRKRPRGIEPTAGPSSQLDRRPSPIYYRDELQDSEDEYCDVSPDLRSRASSFAPSSTGDASESRTSPISSPSPHPFSPASPTSPLLPPTSVNINPPSSPAPQHAHHHHRYCGCGPTAASSPPLPRPSTKSPLTRASWSTAYPIVLPPLPPTASTALELSLSPRGRHRESGIRASYPLSPYSDGDGGGSGIGLESQRSDGMLDAARALYRLGSRPSVQTMPTEA